MKESQPSYSVQTLAEAEAVHVTYALDLYDWNLTKTAAALAINRRTLSRIIERTNAEWRGDLRVIRRNAHRREDRRDNAADRIGRVGKHAHRLRIRRERCRDRILPLKLVEIGDEAIRIELHRLRLGQ